MSGEKCIVCETDEEVGKYKNIDVCLECYATGKLSEYFSEHNIIDGDSSTIIIGE